MLKTGPGYILHLYRGDSKYSALDIENINILQVY